MLFDTEQVMAAEVRIPALLISVLNTWFNLLLMLLTSVDPQQNDYHWQKYIKEAKCYIISICLLSMLGQTVGFIGLALSKKIFLKLHAAIAWLGAFLPSLVLVYYFPFNPIVLLMCFHHQVMAMELAALQCFSRLLVLQGLEKIKAFLGNYLYQQQQKNPVFVQLPQTAP